MEPLIPSGHRGAGREEDGAGFSLVSSSQPDGETPRPGGIFQEQIRGSRAFPGAALW